MEDNKPQPAPAEGLQPATSVQARPQWVKAEDRMPVKNGAYFVKYDDGYSCAGYKDGRFLIIPEPKNIEWLEESPFISSKSLKYKYSNE
jgi:hypothetical protein